MGMSQEVARAGFVGTAQQRVDPQGAPAGAKVVGVQAPAVSWACPTSRATGN